MFVSFPLFCLSLKLFFSTPFLCFYHTLGLLRNYSSLRCSCAGGWETESQTQGARYGWGGVALFTFWVKVERITKRSGIVHRQAVFFARIGTRWRFLCQNITTCSFLSEADTTVLSIELHDLRVWKRYWRVRQGTENNILRVCQKEYMTFKLVRLLSVCAYFKLHMIDS